MVAGMAAGIGALDHINTPKIRKASRPTLKSAATTAMITHGTPEPCFSGFRRLTSA